MSGLEVPTAAKGFLAHELAHDDAVGGVVGELEQIAQHQRDRKADQERSDGSLCHIVRHWEFGKVLSYKMGKRKRDGADATGLL